MVHIFRAIHKRNKCSSSPRSIQPILPFVNEAGSPPMPVEVFASLVAAATDFIGTVDRNGNFLYLNPAGRELLDIPLDEDLTGQSVLPYNDLTWGADKHAAAKTALETGSWSGRHIPVLQTFVVHQTETNTWFSTIARDISDRIARERELQRAADRDPLTGLLNRTAFRREAAQLHRSANTRLTMFDLDDFKKVNDTKGHETGDRLLISLAEHLLQLPHAVTARLGGDEFIMIAERGVFERVVPLLQATLAGAGAGVSYGTVPLHETTDLSAAMREADSKLYQSKRHKQRQAARHQESAGYSEPNADVARQVASS
jgi:diguanylate cyclase (GGDEF)-like protein